MTLTRAILDYITLNYITLYLSRLHFITLCYITYFAVDRITFLRITLNIKNVKC